MTATPAPSGQRIVVIGAGLVGLCCAWLLQRHGHAVLLIDGGATPSAEPSADPAEACGSEAALGVLMARVFHRSSGRAWRLRQRSLALWQQWRASLAERGLVIPWRPGLLLLASGPQDLERQQALLQDPRRPAGALQFWDRRRLEPLLPQLPELAWGGLYSRDDGQLEPLAALQALAADAAAAGMERCSDRVEALEACSEGWLVHRRNGEVLRAGWVVLAAGLGSAALLPRGLQPEPLMLEPVLGQALELELTAEDSAVLDSGLHEAGAGDAAPGDSVPRDEVAHVAVANAAVAQAVEQASLPHGAVMPEAEQPEALQPAAAAARHWPGAVVLRGVNLIQRGRRQGRQRLWLGATLEPGLQAEPEALRRLRSLEGLAPAWLERARTIRHWQGWRARPVGQPAPLLQQPAPRLLLATGHYRNGVLLAPATAEWVLQQIEADRAGRGSCDSALP